MIADMLGRRALWAELVPECGTSTAQNRRERR